MNSDPETLKDDRIKYIARSRPPHLPNSHMLMRHCYLCGLSKNRLDKEHVAPQLLFKGHNPGHYTVLRACRECNAAKGLDDEYITRYLQFSSSVASVDTGIDAAFRGFERPEGRGLLYDVIKNTTMTDISTSEGIYLGQGPVLTIDPIRLRRYLTNIAKGFWTRCSLRLFNWADYRVTVQYEQIAQSQKIFRDPVNTTLRRMAPFGEYWQDFFCYFGGFERDTSYWFFVFYSTHAAMVVFRPKP